MHSSMISVLIKCVKQFPFLLNGVGQVRSDSELFSGRFDLVNFVNVRDEGREISDIILRRPRP